MADFVDLLRENRNYRCTWMGQVVSEIGDYFNNIAVFSLVMQTSGSGLVVSGVMLSRAIPAVMAGGDSAGRRVSTKLRVRLPLLSYAWYERVVNGRPFQFEWDEAKAGATAQKHGVTFELASTVFFDPNMLTVPDVEHSDTEERWFSIGIASNGVLLSVVYLWSDTDPAAIKVRLISARRATAAECKQYEEYT